MGVARALLDLGGGLSSPARRALRPNSALAAFVENLNIVTAGGCLRVGQLRYIGDTLTRGCSGCSACGLLEATPATYATTDLTAPARALLRACAPPEKPPPLMALLKGAWSEGLDAAQKHALFWHALRGGLIAPRTERAVTPAGATIQWATYATNMEAAAAVLEHRRLVYVTHIAV